MVNFYFKLVISMTICIPNQVCFYQVAIQSKDFLKVLIFIVIITNK